MCSCRFCCGREPALCEARRPLGSASAGTSSTASQNASLCTRRSSSTFLRRKVEAARHGRPRRGERAPAQEWGGSYRTCCPRLERHLVGPEARRLGAQAAPQGGIRRRQDRGLFLFSYILLRSFRVLFKVFIGFSDFTRSILQASFVSKESKVVQKSALRRR